MVVRGRDFSDIFDLVGLRVLVESNRDCYAALGVLHVRWNPLPGRFKDYIAMPKFNMYQSLHTTVLGPEGKPVELQIRTDEMHRRAEYGVAAHWKYKEGKGIAAARQGRRRRRRPGLGPPAAGLAARDRRSRASSWTRCGSRSTPPRSTPSPRKGDVVSLPQGSTPIDFAYAIHTEVGNTDHRCPGQRPAGAAGVGAGQRRRGGDLHLQGRRTPGPSRDWLTLRPQPAGPEQDPALLHPGAARGVDRERKGGAGPADAQGRACRCSGC